MRKAKQLLIERLEAASQRRPALTFVAVTCAVLSCVCLLFWFTIFSGLSSTADFIYAGF